MKYKIVVDSSSDMLSSYNTGSVKFEIAPLTIRVNEREFVDDDNLDINEMIEISDSYLGKTTTSCPSPDSYFQAFSEAENVFCVTISSELSGSFNSACLAANMAKEKGINVHVIDSKLTSGAIILIVDELVRLIEKNLSYDEICKKIDSFRDDRKLLFVLSKFANLVKNGRMSKLASIVAGILKIRPLLYGKDGKIEILEKTITQKRSIAKLVEKIGKFATSFKDKVCIIAHVNNLEDAKWIGDDIKNKYDFKEIRIVPCRGLCSIYAQQKGIIVNF